MTSDEEALLTDTQLKVQQHTPVVLPPKEYHLGVYVLS